MPQMRCYLNLMSLEDLAPPRRLDEIAAAGYHGVQFTGPATQGELRECRHLHLGFCSAGRVNQPEEAMELANRFQAEGMECATLHVGWGIEDDAEAGRLIEAVLRASDLLPLFVETHRATLFQDMWRTVQFVRRFPELRFNGDFSHWYTGLEMVYGGFDRKVAFIEPVIDRVRFLHGRIGNPGCIQVDIGDGGAEYVGHFRELWTRSFAAFLRSGQQTMLFVPELLSPRIYYGREFGNSEECDRWEQSLRLQEIAAECFRSASNW